MIKTARKPVRIDLPKINNVLLGCLVILVILAVVMFSNKRQLSLQKLSELPSDTVSSVRNETVEPYPPVNVYLQQVRKRNVFRPGTAENIALGGSMPVTDKDFVLSGIYIGPVPQAIITVQSEQKAYFLKEGDVINGYTVKTILRNKVILERDDEEIELL